jgi:hypothetical protein
VEKLGFWFLEKATRRKLWGDPLEIRFLKNVPGENTGRIDRYRGRYIWYREKIVGRDR